MSNTIFTNDNIHELESIRERLRAYVQAHCPEGYRTPTHQAIEALSRQIDLEYFALQTGPKK